MIKYALIINPKKVSKEFARELDKQTSYPYKIVTIFITGINEVTDCLVFMAGDCVINDDKFVEFSELYEKPEMLDDFHERII